MSDMIVQKEKSKSKMQTAIKPIVFAPSGALTRLTALKLLQLPKKMRAKILTNKQHDHVLVEANIDVLNSCRRGYTVRPRAVGTSNDVQYEARYCWGISKRFGAWAREVEAHVQPGHTFGSAIRYTDPITNQLWIFEVPAGPLRRAKNSIILANAENCEVEVKKNRITIYVAEQEINIIENFPKKHGHYLTDPIFGIPINVKPLNYEDKNARFLYRTRTKVTPIVRGYSYCGYWDTFDGKKIIDGDDQPSDRFGVITLD